MAWPTTEFAIADDRGGIDHVVSVGLPVRHESLTEAPLLLCLDGPWTFGTVLDATRIMSMSGEAPEAVVVGLSFADRSMGEYLRQRARWYTPTPWVPPTITGVKRVEAAECGRATELMSFIATRLSPLLEAEHCGGLQISERWLIGHSFSALFGLQTLFTDHTMFDKWLLASPSIWWDGRAVLDIEAEHAANHDDLPARVFTCYGEYEDQSAGGGPDGGLAIGADEPPFDFRMGANADDLVATLRSRRHPGLELSHAVMSGAHHASTIGPAISQGLRALQ